MVDAPEWRALQAREHERLGILGGTFDPPHRGHLALASAARDQFDLDRVLLVVTGDPWQKRGEVEAAADDRLAMVEAAVSGVDHVEASALEVERRGPTYTADTLEVLAAPERDLFLVVGADVALGLDSWIRPERVRELASLLVADRADGAPPASEVVGILRQQGWQCEVLAMPTDAVSSTSIRQLLSEGQVADELVPSAVMRVIEERGLYTRRR